MCEVPDEIAEVAQTQALDEAPYWVDDETLIPVYWDPVVAD